MLEEISKSNKILFDTMPDEPNFSIYKKLSFFIFD